MLAVMMLETTTPRRLMRGPWISRSVLLINVVPLGVYSCLFKIICKNVDSASFLPYSPMGVIQMIPRWFGRRWAWGNICERGWWIEDSSRGQPDWSSESVGQCTWGTVLFLFALLYWISILFSQIDSSRMRLCHLRISYSISQQRRHPRPIWIHNVLNPCRC